MRKAGLPTEGDVSFIPRLVTNLREEEVVLKKEVLSGPKAGKVGYVDTQDRTWIKDRAHSGYPDHWDVQENDGLTYFRFGLDGTLLS
jgi:hypothetical protein